MSLNVDDINNNNNNNENNYVSDFDAENINWKLIFC